MPNFLYDMPTWTMVILVTAFFVGLTWLGTIFIRPILRTFVRRQAGANDLVAYLLGAHGVYFGILLGLLSLSAYGNFTSSEDLVADEASKLASLYRNASSYPSPFREELTMILKEYTNFVIEKGWPQQRQGIIPREGIEYINRFQDRMMSFEPQTRGQEILHAEELDCFRSLIEARRKRLSAVTAAIPDILWYVVYIGVLVNMVLIWLLDMKVHTSLFLGGLITFFLATLIALIGAMDKPFRGEVSVSPEPYKAVYDQLMSKPLRPVAAKLNAAP